jgi:hypothetical protein
MANYRLLPRYRSLPIAAAGLGVAIAAVGAFRGTWSLCAIGGIAVALAAAYLWSPSWRMQLITSDTGLTFQKANGAQRFVAWNDVKRLLVAPNQTCLMVGTDAETSLIVPGLGAPAPYDIQNKAALFAEMTAKVANSKQRTVETIETAIADKLPWADEP